MGIRGDSGVYSDRSSGVHVSLAQEYFFTCMHVYFYGVASTCGLTRGG